LKLIALTLIAPLATACQAEQPLSVHETIKNIHSLNGKTVRVVGYLGQCGGYDCQLFENKQDRDAAYRWSAAVRAHHQPDPLPAELKRPPPDGLGIGAGKLICPSPSARNGCYFEVDKKAEPFTNSYVLVTGKVSDVCRDEQLRWGCTDRGPELEPTAFAKWTPPRKEAS
jgi:hypothetical protein